MIKEGVHTIRSNLHYKVIPNIIKIKLVKFITMWLIAILTKGEIYYTLIPWSIVPVTNINFNNHYITSFWSY